MGATRRVGVRRRPGLDGRLGRGERVAAGEVERVVGVPRDRAALGVRRADRGARVGRAGVVLHPVPVVLELGPGARGADPADVVVHPVQEAVAEVGAPQRLGAEVELTGDRARAGVPPRLPDHLHRGLLHLQRAVGGDRLVEVEQGVLLALHEQRRCLHVAHVGRDRGVLRERRRGLAGVALGVQLGRADAGLVDEVGAEAHRLGVGRRVLRAGHDAGAEEQVDPLLLRDVARRERVGQVVPGDDRDDRVDAGVLLGDGVLDLAAVRAADHADARVARGLGRDHLEELGGARALGEVAALAGEHVDHLPTSLAVPVRVVERDLAVGLPEAQARVAQHGVPLAHEALADGGLVAVGLVAAEAVGAQDRGDLASRAGAVGQVEVCVDAAVLLVGRADLHVDGEGADAVAGGVVGSGCRRGRPGEGQAGGGEGGGRQRGDECSGHAATTTHKRTWSRGGISSGPARTR